MALAIVGTPTTENSGNSNVAISTPTGAVSGNILVWCLNVETNSTVATPSGWTAAIASPKFDNTSYLYVWYQVLTAAPANSYTATYGVNAHQQIMVCFSGENTTTPTDGVNSAADTTTSSSTFKTGSVTTTKAGDAVISFFTNDGPFSPTVEPTGATNYTNINMTGAEDLAFCWIAQAAAGAINPSWTIGTTANYAGVTLALQPAASGGGSALSQTLTDAHSALDTTTRRPIKPVSDSHSGLDSLVRQPTKVLSDAHSGLDSWQKLYTALRVDTFSETDTSSRQPSKSLGDAHSARDSLTTQSGHLISLTDAHSALDILVKSVRALKTDAFSLIDALSKTPAKTFLEWFSETDSLTHSLFTANNWQKTITDSHSALDVLSKQMTHYTADRWSSLDSFTRLWVAHVVITDAFSETDAVQKSVAKRLLDTQFGQDVVSRVVGHLLTLADAFSETDAVQKTMLHAIAETFSATDSTARSLTRLLFDSLSQTDKMTVGRGLLLTLLDSFSLTDAPLSVVLGKPITAQILGAITSLVAQLVGTVTLVSPSGTLTAQPHFLPSAIGALLSFFS